MAQFIYGSTSSAQSRFYQTVLALTEESVNVEENSSVVRYTLTVYAGNTAVSQWRTGARIMLGGVEYVHRDGSLYENQISIERYGSCTLASGVITVPHDKDGSCVRDVSFTVYHPSTASYTPGNFTYTGGTLTLTQIARASTVTVSDSAAIGGSCSLWLKRASESFTHVLAWSFGALSGYIGADGNAADAPVYMADAPACFFVPESFYGQIPFSDSGICTVTVTTYQDGSPVGTHSASFTVLEAAAYERLTVHENVVRLTPTGNTVQLTLYGNCYGGSLGAQENVLTVRYRIADGEEVAVSPQISAENSYMLTVMLDRLDYTQTHTLYLCVSDALMRIEKTVVIGKGEPVFDWSETDFAFHVPVSAPRFIGAFDAHFCYRGVCADANEAKASGIYLLVESSLNAPNTDGILVVFNCSENNESIAPVLQLAVNFSGIDRSMRTLWYDLAPSAWIGL